MVIVFDRLIIIPFDAEFKEGSAGYDKHIQSKLRLEEARMYLIRVGIEGLKRIHPENAEFTRSDKVEKQREEYESENNPITGFIQDSDVDTDIVNESTADVYRRYTVSGRRDIGSLSAVEIQNGRVTQAITDGLFRIL